MGPRWPSGLGSWPTTLYLRSFKPITTTMLDRASLTALQKWGALDSHRYVIEFVSDSPKVGGFLRALRFPPQVTLTAMRLFE